MNKDQINKLKALDPQGINGTIQNVLLRDDIDKLQFSDACWWLLNRVLEEKQATSQENEKLSKILKKNGLYTSENLFGDG